MPLFRLLGFQQLDCGCLVAQYHKATVDRELCREQRTRLPVRRPSAEPPHPG